MYIEPSQSLSRTQLHKIPIPDRGPLPLWQGVQHGELADLIVKTAQSLGLEIQEERWKTNTTGTDLWGALDFSNVPDVKGKVQRSLPPGIGLSLGVRHSNAGRRALQFAVGARVYVCSNGLFVGDFVVSRRHTRNVDLEALVRSGFERYMSRVVEDVTALQLELSSHPITDGMACRVMLLAAELGVLPWKSLKGVYTLWEYPAHPEFEPRTEWSLFNCFTEQAKQLSLPKQYKLHEHLEELLRASRI